MIRNVCFTLLCCLINYAAFAQNTLVMGKVKNLGLVKHIELEVNHRYIDSQADTYRSNILEDGSFAFAVQVDQAQLVNLYFSRNSSQVYLEPNDTLVIEFDANSFNHSFNFSGRSGANNDYLKKHVEKYPKEKDVFKYLQYRVGTLWYKISPQHDEWMRTMHKAPYLKKMKLRKEEPLSQLDFHEKNTPNRLTPEFVDFLRAEINYDWAYHMMLFGNVYKGMHDLDASFLDFTKDIPLQNDQLGSEWYRLYLLAYSNQEYLKQEEKAATPYTGQYVLSESFLSGKPLAFVQSEMISIGFSKKYINETLPDYQHFITHNPYVEFDDKIVAAYQKVMKTAIGSVAPSFTIGGDSDAAISLSDYQGKVVFLNFWASWCRPCMKKMDEMKSLQAEMEAQGVVFINVSFDQTNEAWMKTVNEKNYGGVHVIVPGNVESEIAQQYQVRAIPQYFIIDKKGRFAERPIVYSLETVKDVLQKQLER